MNERLLPSTAIFRRGDEGETLDVVGDHVRILADSVATAGSCAGFEVLTPPGGGPPLHRHGRDDEYFFHLAGCARFRVGGDERVLTAGGFPFAPRGSVHTDGNAGSTPLRMLVMCIPGSLEGCPSASPTAWRARGRSRPRSSPRFSRNSAWRLLAVR